MYSLKVRGVVQKNDASPFDKVDPSDEEKCSSSQQASPQTASPRGTANASGEVDQLSFSAGNPRVEHLTGVVHLYRHLTEDGALPSGNGDGTSHGPTHSSHSSSQTRHLPPNRSEQLCVLALPPDMGFPEFCTFLGAYFDRVKEVRLVRRDSAAKSTCLVLLRFDAQDAADGFYTDFNGEPFCMLEPEFVCRLLYVKDVEVSDSSTAATAGSARSPTLPTNTTQDKETTSSASSASASAAKPTPETFHPVPPPGATELPSCPVCLERLDDHISGVVTTVCNHRFHNQCLRQWGDTSCPVCRYCQHPTEGTSHCASCGTSSDLWICLICGHVGCGRYKGSHAETHWRESGHGYALELESQRVWDYASDAYVHRLVRSKTDGKIVEVPAPGNRGGECSSGGRDAHCGEECSSGAMGMDPEVEEALVISKLDALAVEYNHLLVTQLDSQRQHFETLLEKQRDEFEAAMEEEAVKVESAATAAEKASIDAAEAQRRRQKVESKLAEVTGHRDTLLKEKEFLKQLNETLLANQKAFSEKLKAAEQRAAEQAGVITELQEQVRDLMVYLEAQQTIAASGGGDLAGGTVLPLPEAPQRRGRKKK